MKTKRFYSYLLAAFCCLCAVFALTSCHPDDEGNENENGGNKKSNGKIEYIKFKEPCLMKGATKDEVKMWMAKNMPDYELGLDEMISMVFSYKGDVTLSNVAYTFENGQMYIASCKGIYSFKSVSDILCEKYGTMETESIMAEDGITLESYTFHPQNMGLKWISLDYMYEDHPVANVNSYCVNVGYFFD